MSLSHESCALSARGTCVRLIIPPLCDVPEGDCGAVIMSRPWSSRGCFAMGGKIRLGVHWHHIYCLL
jgi:hypothetical protein